MPGDSARKVFISAQAPFENVSLGNIKIGQKLTICNATSVGVDQVETKPIEYCVEVTPDEDTSEIDRIKIDTLLGMPLDVGGKK